jgi:hypothetical protein
VLTAEMMQRPSLLIANGRTQSSYQPTMPNVSSWAIEQGNRIIDIRDVIKIVLGVASPVDAAFTIYSVATGLEPPDSQFGKLATSAINLVGEANGLSALALAVLAAESWPALIFPLAGLYVLGQKAGDQAIDLANDIPIRWQNNMPKSGQNNIAMPGQPRSEPPARGTPEGDLFDFRGQEFRNDGPTEPSGPMPRPGFGDEGEFDA